MAEWLAEGRRDMRGLLTQWAHENGVSLA